MLLLAAEVEVVVGLLLSFDFVWGLASTAGEAFGGALSPEVAGSVPVSVLDWTPPSVFDTLAPHELAGGSSSTVSRLPAEVASAVVLFFLSSISAACGGHVFLKERVGFVSGAMGDAAATLAPKIADLAATSLLGIDAVLTAATAFSSTVLASTAFWSTALRSTAFWSTVLASAAFFSTASTAGGGEARSIVAALLSLAPLISMMAAADFAPAALLRPAGFS